MANDRPPWDREEAFPIGEQTSMLSPAGRGAIAAAEAHAKRRKRPSALAMTRAQSALRGKAIEQAIRAIERAKKAGPHSLWEAAPNIAAKLRKAIGMKADG